MQPFLWISINAGSLCSLMGEIKTDALRLNDVIRMTYYERND